ncbi:Hypothetical protein ABZS17G119_01479 [Kosakonia cowanii]
MDCPYPPCLAMGKLSLVLWRQNVHRPAFFQLILLARFGF